MKKISVLALLVVVVDQVLKLLILKSLALYQEINIISDIFTITHVHNTGAAFSMLSNNTYLLIAIALISLVVIYYFLIKNMILMKFDIFIYSLLIGGIIGNLLDRILYGYVIDYLSFKIINYNFPIFNFADICIVISIIMIVLKYLREEVCRKLK